MLHDPLHYRHAVAYVEERERLRNDRLRHAGGERSRRPGRLRRATARGLLRAAARLTHEPITATPRRA